jgi:hypothetical protein
LLAFNAGHTFFGKSQPAKYGNCIFDEINVNVDCFGELKLFLFI